MRNPRFCPRAGACGSLPMRSMAASTMAATPRVVWRRASRPIREPDDRILFAQTFSKNWAMTGWRMGWLQGPPAIGQIVENHIQYNTSGVAPFMQRAGIAAIEKARRLRRRPDRARLRRPRNCLRHAGAFRQRPFRPPKRRLLCLLLRSTATTIRWQRRSASSTKPISASHRAWPSGLGPKSSIGFATFDRRKHWVRRCSAWAIGSTSKTPPDRDAARTRQANRGRRGARPISGVPRCLDCSDVGHEHARARRH